MLVNIPAPWSIWEKHKPRGSPKKNQRLLKVQETASASGLRQWRSQLTQLVEGAQAEGTRTEPSDRGFSGAFIVKNNGIPVDKRWIKDDKRWINGDFIKRLRYSE